MASSQHRCVFVGNIPYDATEEQLIEICREVGPVVSFRLVIDRETGKPKGYGFCEYKDEETALSARRNLQGYEINGRQLRVDFAENDKGSDRNREQAGLQPNQNVLPNQSAPASDPLTLHLAKMSRSQLNEIMSELKKMATRNKELARELLLSKPQLLKAIFQAQIMLGMVTKEVMPNIQQPPGQLAEISIQDGQHSKQPIAQTLHQKAQTGLIPKVLEASTIFLQSCSTTSCFTVFCSPTSFPKPPCQTTNSGDKILIFEPASADIIATLGTACNC
ncbi:hypothetical protein ERO13_D06G114601v2 [Gossypium hirsutum]|nr:hypothetical protein ERO13_D06G114601v2 [Gossypium hirsutum]